MNKLPHNTTYRDIAPPRTGDHPAFAAMREEARRLQLPRTFATDVDLHDRTCLLARDWTRPFGWLLYGRGAHLVWESKILSTVVECFGSDGPDYMGPSALYLWDGRRLRQATQEEIVEELDAWNDSHSAVKWRKTS